VETRPVFPAFTFHRGYVHAFCKPFFSLFPPSNRIVCASQAGAVLPLSFFGYASGISWLLAWLSPARHKSRRDK